MGVHSTPHFKYNTFTVAISVFKPLQMKQTGREKMETKMLQILQACKSVKQLKQTHLQILIQGLQHNTRFTPKLINFSSSLGFLDHAVRIFGHSHTQNVYIYNTMIECFTRFNRRKDAFITYNSMNNASAISPNTFTFTILLKSCSSYPELNMGTQVQNHVVKLGFGCNVFVQNTLLDFYASGGEDLGCACRVFDEMTERDVVSWNSMISAYMGWRKTSEAVRLFESMPERNVVSWNSIVAGFCRNGDMESAKSAFAKMPVRNEVSWNSMISGYVKKGDVGNARGVFDSMQRKTVVSWTVMISGYAKVGELSSAIDLFRSMLVKNTITWNSMIAGYVQNNMFNEALGVFRQMLADGQCKPDESTLISVLSACAHLGSLKQGKWIESYIKKNGCSLGNSLGNALIDMFGKCGDMKSAMKVFHQMMERCIITWTSIVSGLATNGLSKEALSLFDTMCEERVEPDDVIFISLMSACSHGGLVEEGKHIFNQMIQKFGIKPRIEHYGCMVDLLSRAGKVKEAYRFIMSMPMEPNAVIWANLLASCKFHGNLELAEDITRKILDLAPSDPGYNMLVSNLNASFGQWEDVLNLRILMRKEGIEKVPGCSSIQIEGTVHEFLVRDATHRRRKDIYQTIDILGEHLKGFSDRFQEASG